MVEKQGIWRPMKRPGNTMGYIMLHGAISPMLGIGPNDIKLKELMHRLQADVEEVIIATNSSLEGETTGYVYQQTDKANRH